MRQVIGLGVMLAFATTVGTEPLKVFEKAEPGTWAASAYYLWPGPTAIADMPSGGRKITLTAPDGSITMKVDDTEIRLVDHKDASRFRHSAVSVESLAEVLWAPDSKAFVITESYGGWVGTWASTVYRPGAREIVSSNPGALALQDFKYQFPQCPEEVPNVAAVAWVGGSDRLLLIVEMPCHSSCREMCKFMGYIVDPATGAIRERLSEPEVRAGWRKSLGSRIQEPR